jgi:hypothetical protein
VFLQKHAFCDFSAKIERIIVESEYYSFVRRKTNSVCVIAHDKGLG